MVNNQQMHGPNLLPYFKFHPEPTIDKFTEAYEGDLWLQAEGLVNSSVDYKRT